MWYSQLEDGKEKVHRQGYLSKQGGTGIQLMGSKKWHSRWCVLKGSRLLYYSKEGDTKLLGTTDLIGCLLMETQVLINEQSQYGIEIGPDTVETRGGSGSASTVRTVLLTSSEQERSAWMSALRRALHGHLGGGLFGRCLDDTMDYEERIGHRIPEIVEQCVEYLRGHLNTEGLFRLSGRVALLKSLRKRYDEGERPDLTQEGVDPSTAASLLKLYLRELPEPLIPYSKFMDFLDIGTSLRFDSNAETARAALGDLIRVLPARNRRLLAFLVRFLQEVSEHSASNRMGIENLATIFGTNVLRMQDDSPEFQLGTHSLTSTLFKVMLEAHEQLFTDDEKEGESDLVCSDADASSGLGSSFGTLISFANDGSSLNGGLTETMENGVATFCGAPSFSDSLGDLAGLDLSAPQSRRTSKLNRVTALSTNLEQSEIEAQRETNKDRELSSHKTEGLEATEKPSPVSTVDTSALTSSFAAANTKSIVSPDCAIKSRSSPHILPCVSSPTPVPHLSSPTSVSSSCSSGLGISCKDVTRSSQTSVNSNEDASSKHCESASSKHCESAKSPVRIISSPAFFAETEPTNFAPIAKRRAASARSRASALSRPLPLISSRTPSEGDSSESRPGSSDFVGSGDLSHAQPSMNRSNSDKRSTKSPKDPVTLGRSGSERSESSRSAGNGMASGDTNSQPRFFRGFYERGGSHKSNSPSKEKSQTGGSEGREGGASGPGQSPDQLIPVTKRPHRPAVTKPVYGQKRQVGSRKQVAAVSSSTTVGTDSFCSYVETASVNSANYDFAFQSDDLPENVDDLRALAISLKLNLYDQREECRKLKAEMASVKEEMAAKDDEHKNELWNLTREKQQAVAKVVGLQMTLLEYQSAHGSLEG